MSYKTRLIRHAALVGALSLCTAATAFGQTASTTSSLWQNATDVSTNSNWLVYAVVLNGIKYIQIKDEAGTVHALIGVINGTPFVTPMGVDALNVSTPTSSAASTANDAGATQTVYNDGATTVAETPQSDGTTRFTVQSNDSCPTTGCAGGGGS